MLVSSITESQICFADAIKIDAFDNSAVFNAEVQNNPAIATFKPPAVLVQTYLSQGRAYEIWCGELTDPTVRLLLERLQIFTSFFIEGGTPIYLDDEQWTLARWRVFFVYVNPQTYWSTKAFTNSRRYEKLANPPSGSSPYSIVGYSTSYRFLTYQHTKNSPTKALEPFHIPTDPPISVSSLPSRSRISQFLILPPHQSQSHGSHLYNTMITTFLSDPVCTEITVEDPNEAFDDLRDYCDYNRLLRNGTFAQIKLNTNLDPKSTVKRAGVRVPTSKLLDTTLLKDLRKKNKMAPRQFERMVEMYLFSKIPQHTRQAGTARLTQRAKATDENDRAYYYWRLLVKQRVYKQNKDSLMQLDRVERIEKVEDVVGVLVGDYERLLRRLESGPEQSNEEVDRAARRGKRKIFDDDDDEVEEEQEQGEENGEGRIPIREERRWKRSRQDDG